MQIFNDFSTKRKESNHIFSDEEVKASTKYIPEDDCYYQRKAKSQETERNNSKKYRLDSNKITKEFT